MLQDFVKDVLVTLNVHVNHQSHHAFLVLYVVIQEVAHMSVSRVHLVMKVTGLTVPTLMR